MTIYAGTATQIVGAEGEEGLRHYLSRLRDIDPNRKANLIGADGKVWFGESNEVNDSGEIVKRTLESGTAETDFTSDDRSLGAAAVDFPDGRRFALVLQWERGTPPSLFFGSWLAYLRLGGLLLTAFMVCSLLAWYLTSPIRKLREATHKFADGDLQTRVAPQVGVALHHPFLGARGHEIRHADARRDAGRTFGAGRAVKHVLRPPEPLLREHVVQLLRMIALQRGEQLSFHPPLKIGAGLGCGHVELRRNRKGMAHVALAPRRE